MPVFVDQVYCNTAAPICLHSISMETAPYNRPHLLKQLLSGTLGKSSATPPPEDAFQQVRSDLSSVRKTVSQPRLS